MTVGLWLLSMTLLYIDSITLNSALYVTLLITLFGLILHNSNDVAAIKQEVKDLKSYIINKDVRK